MDKKRIVLLSLAVSVILLTATFAIIKTVSFDNQSIVSGDKAIKGKKAEANDIVQAAYGKPVKIMFLGDIMLDRHIRQASQKNGYDFVFQKSDELFLDNDLVVGNLEGPITDNKSVSLQSKVGERNNFIFTFDPQITEALKKRNISLVNIGNNHIDNFGLPGLQSTREYLDRSGINFFGDHESIEKRTAIINFNNKNIAFVNFNQFVTNAQQKAFEDLEIMKLSKADFIVLYTHWGEEYKPVPNEKIKSLAHEFIDKGVDLIIGTHPHVIQSKEKYNGKDIYYSLGNFVFDQYFDPNTKKGLVVEANFDFAKDEIVTRDFFVSMESNGQTVYSK